MREGTSEVFRTTPLASVGGVVFLSDIIDPELDAHALRSPPPASLEAPGSLVARESACQVLSSVTNISRPPRPGEEPGRHAGHRARLSDLAASLAAAAALAFRGRLVAGAAEQQRARREGRRLL